jgi:hypothetical protein
MYCYNLNLDIKPLKFDLELRDVRCSHEHYTLNDINPVLVDFLDQRNIRVGWVEIFHKDPSMSAYQQIHIDEYRGDFVKLNWVYGGADSYMCWYKEKDTVEKTIQSTEVNTPYLSYKLNEVTMLHKENLQGPCIIQAGIPHNVIMGREYRHALSMVLLDKSSTVRRRLPYAESVIALADIISR